MTIDRVAMKELLEKGSDQDLLREMLAFVAARMMDVEVESLTGAAHGERSPERTNQRNGYRTREWHTGVGRRVDVDDLEEHGFAAVHDGRWPKRQRLAERERLAVATERRRQRRVRAAAHALRRLRDAHAAA